MSKYMDVPPTDDDIILCGYQRKLKTMKKKYFVLYKSTQYSVARLEYYDSEKKFKSKLSPKRVIELKNCFNINRRLDTKFEFVISLSTRDGGFGIVLESEQEMKKWLEVLIHFQRFETNATDAYHQHFDHVWQVQVQRKGLAEDKGIFGSFHVGLTNKSVTFIRIGSERSALGETRKTNIEFLLTTIRRCGDSQCFFYMEVGRQSITGPGELWMATEDSLTAQNMHKMILSAMSSKTDSTMEPMRKRSSSANEASKPINVMYRRQTQTECKTGNSPQCIQNYVRERCDSLPSRNRIPSESNNQSTVSIQNLRNTNNQRIQLLQRQSNSPPIGSTAVCSESEESSVSIEEQDDSSCLFTYRFHSRSSEGVIPEENTDEIIYTDNKTSEMQSKAENATSKNAIENYVSMAPVKNVSALTENNKVINLKPKHFLTDGRGRLPAPLNSELHRSAIEFTEIAADRLPKPEANEMETQVERPTRTFSIGSRIEHSRIHQRLTHSNENDANCRVRAFSVGSRSKIPQCELQNGSLHSKNSKDNFNSNNNILSHHHHSVSCPEKKSISAPLLLNKSHNSVDLMGDLMEIDFSKNVHLTNSLRCPAANTTLPKTFLTTNPEGKNNFYVDEPIVGDSKIVEMDHNFAQNDNGYLEMKPVGNTITLRNPVPTVNELSALCTNSKQKLNTKMGALELNANEIVSNCEKERLDYKKTGNTSNSSKKLDVNSCKEKAKMRKDGDHETRDIICVTDSGISYNTKAKASIAKSRLVSKKLLHSESDENNGTSKVNCKNKNFGYELLQIKGDCCLDENKQTNRLHSSTSKYSSFNLQNGMNFGDESYPTPTVSNLKECTETSSEMVKASDLTSGSCYSNKKQQLYYASLDLSPSCTEYKNVSKDDNPNLSTPISTPVQTPSPSVNNLYAKIDFEYSDSSSSSNQVNA